MNQLKLVSTWKKKLKFEKKLSNIAAIYYLHGQLEINIYIIYLEVISTNEEECFFFSILINALIDSNDCKLRNDNLLTPLTLLIKHLEHYAIWSKVFYISVHDCYGIRIFLSLYHVFFFDGS